MNDKNSQYQIDINTLIGEKPIKIILYVGAGLLTLYAMGHLFKLCAHTIRGYNEFKSAVAGK